jgi:protein MpaA
MNDETHDRLIPREHRGTLALEPRVYGRSARGVALESYGAQLGPVDILLLASMHGDESDTTVVLSEALRAVRPEAVRNPVVLSVNPDGVLRGTRCNARGVDLNRNLPTANWSANPVYYRGHGRKKQDMRLGTGEFAGSEPETQALTDLVDRLQPRVVVSLHAPLACVEDPQCGALARWIADGVGLPLVADVGYATPGSFGTWCGEKGIDIITWELPAEPLPAILASHVPVLQKLIMGDYPSGLTGGPGQADRPA